MDDTTRINKLAQQIIDGYDGDVDFDAHAVATELVERHGFTELDEGLRSLPPGQFEYWSLVTRFRH